MAQRKRGFEVGFGEAFQPSALETLRAVLAGPSPEEARMRRESMELALEEQRARSSERSIQEAKAARLEREEAERMLGPATKVTITQELISEHPQLKGLEGKEITANAFAGLAAAFDRKKRIGDTAGRSQARLNFLESRINTTEGRRLKKLDPEMWGANLNEINTLRQQLGKTQFPQPKNNQLKPQTQVPLQPQPDR